jgi:UDP-2,3-diacylglucosamine hydrolase
MQFVTISDVHIKEPGDKQEELFLKFLESDEVSKSSIIFLLGDIFDLVVGGHEDYYEKYKTVFDKLSQQCGKGKKIIQFEGNHDFHFPRLIKLIQEKNSLSEGSWEYHKKPLVLELQNRRILFAHGDEIEIENLSYNIYKAFIRSWPINFLANSVVPFSFVDGVGQYLSRKSRNRNNKRYSDELNEIIKDKFRRTFKKAQKDFKVDDVICGHSHCLDFYIDKGIYLNNGFFPATEKFNFFDGSEYRQVKLDQRVVE